MIITKYLLLFLAFSVFKEAGEGNNWSLVAGNFNFPEGPAWDMQNKILYVSNCYGDFLAKITGGKVDALVRKSDSAISKTNGLFVDNEGNVIACDFGKGAILKISHAGKVSTLIAGYKGEKFNRPNDLVITPAGNLYFSDPESYGKNKLDGRIFFFNMKTGELKLVAEKLAFPNGVNISPLDGKLYVSESAQNRVLRFTINEDNTLSGKEVFIELPGGDPDGLEFDTDGNLYVAHFGSGTVYVISPEREILSKIKTPGKKPSNLEFGGDDLSILFLTEDETNAVYKMQMKAKGNKFFNSGEDVK